jgi:hypothetical protein
MERAETKAEYIVRAKALLRADLRAKSWPEKARSIERMNEAGKIARESMKQAKSRQAEDSAKPR